MINDDNKIELEISEGMKLSYDEKMEILRDFARELMSLFDKSQSEEDIRFKEFFGVDKKDIKLLVHEVPPYQRNQTIFSINEFINTKCKNIVVENFDENKITPSYEAIEVKRNEFKMFVNIGYFFFEWEKTKFIIDLTFSGNTRYYRIWFKNDDEKVAMKLQESLFDYLKENNFLKGEKLLFLPNGHLVFLEYPKLDWNDVILNSDMKNEIILNIVFPLENKKLCKENGIPWRRGVLTGGVAGTGKTQVCRVLCNELPKNVTVIWATPKAVSNEFEIQLLFEASRFFSPTLIVIEDIDFIGLQRDFSHNPILGELLTQLDGNDPNDGIFVVATTNRPELLDEALANRPSRFDVQLLFELPNPDERKQIIELFTKNMKFGEDLNLTTIVEATKGLSGSHIKEIFVHSQMKALKEERKVMNKDILDKAEKYRNKLNKNSKGMVR